MGKILSAIVVVSCLLFAACAEIERSAGGVLDNANSVLKTGRNVAFGTEPTPAPSHDRRY